MPDEWSDPERVDEYLSREIPHRLIAEAMLLEALPERIDRFLDLGTGDGRLLALIRSRYPDAQAIGIDISEPMLVLAEERFNGDPLIDICIHDLDDALPPMGSFDAVVSGLAIHHLHDMRKHELTRIFHEETAPRVFQGAVSSV